uniref:Uncharacterized protein n=1 Tax=Cacopsylla melanoneura TaxID=428564 RepID=A0A8D8VEA1_9HEMI
MRKARLLKYIFPLFFILFVLWITKDTIWIVLMLCSHLRFFFSFCSQSRSLICRLLRISSFESVVLPRTPVFNFIRFGSGLSFVVETLSVTFRYWRDSYFSFLQCS